MHGAIALWLYFEERLAPNDNSQNKEMANTKKSRNVNFSLLEVEVLLSHVFDKKGPLFGTSSSKVKEAIWCDIAKEITNLGVSSRKADEVRTKFSNIKYQALKELSTEKREMGKTGRSAS